MFLSTTNIESSDPITIKNYNVYFTEFWLEFFKQTKSQYISKCWKRNKEWQKEFWKKCKEENILISKNNILFIYGFVEGFFESYLCTVLYLDISPETENFLKEKYDEHYSESYYYVEGNAFGALLGENIIEDEKYYLYDTDMIF